MAQLLIAFNPAIMSMYYYVIFVLFHSPLNCSLYAQALKKSRMSEVDFSPTYGSLTAQISE